MSGMCRMLIQYCLPRKKTMKKTLILNTSAMTLAASLAYGDPRPNTFPRKVFPRVRKCVSAGLEAAILATAMLGASAMADTLDASAFAKKLRITFPGYAGTETLVDFPVLVKLSEANEFDHSKCASGGSDLRFALADGTLLPHEIDTWNDNGTSLVWVKVPELTASTVIYAYYGGNGTLPSVTASDVWSNGFVGVWHLGSKGNQTQADSSTNGLDMLCHNYDLKNVNLSASGIIGGSVGFNTASGYYDNQGVRRGGGLYHQDANSVLSDFSDSTFEAWLCPTNAPDGNVAILAARSNNATGAYYVYMTSALKPAMNLYPEDGTTKYISAFSKAMTSGDWNYMAISRSGETGNICGYLDGSLALNVNSATGPYNKHAGGVVIGNNSSSLEGWGNYYVSQPYQFPGYIDEVRISSVVRSANWQQATYDCVTKNNFAEYEEVAISNSWDDYAKKFTVTFPGATNGVVENFPVLVRMSETTISGFDYDDCQKDEGRDLRFADENGNLLASEVDTWNTNGESTVWVKVPSLTASTKITGYYGCAAPHAVTASDVWTNGFNAVWHLGGSEAPLAESTGNATPFTEGNVAPTYAAAGVVGKAVDFLTNDPGNTQNRLVATDSDALDGFGDFTVEYWSYQETYRNNQFTGILAKRNSSYNQEAWFVYQGQSPSSYQYATFAFNFDSKEANRAAASAGARPTPGEWVHQAFFRTVDDGKGSWYFNGTSKKDFTFTSASAKEKVLAGTAPLYLGGGTGQYSFPGSIDEVRISSVARDAAWLKTTHDCVALRDFAAYGAARANASSRATVLFFR